MQPILNEAQKQQFIRDGYVVARGLLPRPLVEATRVNLLRALQIDVDDPFTWEGKSYSSDPDALAATVPCRTTAVEQVAEELVGSGFVHGLAYSPFLAARGIVPSTIKGYIPVLNFPVPGAQRFECPLDYHIDGMAATALWPVYQSLVVFAYLTDVREYGGATTVLPGSHLQIFRHFLGGEAEFNGEVPHLQYADPMPVAGAAGDVIFMHYLLAHSGSANHSDQIRVGLNTAIMADPDRPYVPRTGLPTPDWTPLDHTLQPT